MHKTREHYIETVLPQNMIGAELGVFEGEFSDVLRRSEKFNKLYLVDIFEGNMFSGDKNGENGKIINLTNAYNNLSNIYKDDKVVELIRGTSFDFLQKLDNDFLSFVYIDADHSYEAVKKDLEISRVKVKNNGIISGHDYDESQFYGVFLAVNEFIMKYNLEIQLTIEDKLSSYFIINRK